MACRYPLDPELFALLVRLHDEVRHRYQTSETLRVMLPSVLPLLREIEKHVTHTRTD